MNKTAPKRAPLTDDMLLAAWERLRTQRAHWPRDYGQAMGDPLISCQVRSEAAVRARQLAGVGQATHATRQGGAQATQPRRWPMRFTPTHSAPVDRKRAAAGDRDD